MLSVLWTTDIYNSLINICTNTGFWLWFAFSSLNNWYLQQHSIWHCHVWHPVVICFQFFEQLIFTTAEEVLGTNIDLLWFAFSSLNNWYLQQLYWWIFWRMSLVVICFQFFEQLIFTTAISNIISFHLLCCDLLSVLLNYWYLQQLYWRLYLINVFVVICFQFFEQLIFTTAWWPVKLTAVTRCDLLSFFEQLIFTTANCLTEYITNEVVICFQFFEQLIFTTAYRLSWSATLMLWFAFSSFNNWYLQQHWFVNIREFLRLWFAFILWTTDIYNSCRSIEVLLTDVVICFQFFEQLIFTTAFSTDSLMSISRCDLLSFF